MATTKFSPQKNVNRRGPMTLLAGAICEWVLIFLIFVDATFSYILRRFAEYCDLPTPCILCSRIDAPSGKRKFEYYNALLCRNHKEEISSLASCHAHGKLTDVRELCEECFMPMYDKLNSGSYIVGKLGKDVEKHSVQSLALHKKILPDSSGPKICSCCNRSWGVNLSAQTFLQLTPVGLGASKANVKPPLPRVQGRSRFSRKNSFKKLSDTLAAPAIPQFEGKSLSEALSHVGYTELKFTSDTESEVNFSDDEESVSAVLGRNYKNLEHDSDYVAETLLELQTDDAVFEKHSNQNFAEVASLLDQHMQLETHKPIPTHGLEELTWEKPHPMTDSSVSPDLNILDDVSNGRSNVSGDASITVKPQPYMPSVVMPAELIPLKNTPLCSGDRNQETLKSHDEDDMTLRQPTNSTVFSYADVPDILNEISSTNASAMTDEGKEVSTTSIEQPSTSGSSKFEGIKSVIQKSAPKQDDSLNVDESSYDLKHVQALASLERNDSSLKLKERVSLPNVSTKLENKSVVQHSSPEQDDSQNVGESGSDFNHVKVLASLERNDSSLKLKERVSLPSVSTKFEDSSKLVTQHSAHEQDDSQNVGESSSDFNHVKVLASLERNYSNLKLKERVSLPSVCTKVEDNKSVIQHSAPEQDDSPNVGESSSDFNHVKALASLERNYSNLKLKERVSLPSVSTKVQDNKSVIQQHAPEQDEIQNSDDLRSDGNHVQALPSLERNDSSLKLEERVSLSDVQDESSIDMLKSQIEYDRKCLNDLYKELEEERNASTIAANEAMAMITRLQEEKAQLHMEALQYLRMMDEQAEYDMEALQKANDDLSEKEKELQDLEYELELYRNNFHGGSPVLDPHKESIITMAENKTEDSCVHHNESSMYGPSSPISSKMSKANEVSGNAKSSISNLDEEKLYLVEYLKQLERRIHDVSCTKPSAGFNNSGHLEQSNNKTGYPENSSTHDQVESVKEADGLHMQNGFSKVDGTSSKNSPTHLSEDRDTCCEETNHNRSNWQTNSTSGREPNMETLEHETENFKERLKAFEGDLKFIKHSLRTLHNGNDGLEYIQQIINQLQELRNIEFKKEMLIYS